MSFIFFSLFSLFFPSFNLFLFQHFFSSLSLWYCALNRFFSKNWSLVKGQLALKIQLFLQQSLLRYCFLKLRQKCAQTRKNHDKKNLKLSFWRGLNKDHWSLNGACMGYHIKYGYTTVKQQFFSFLFSFISHQHINTLDIVH